MLNNVAIQGRLCADPEYGKTKNDRTYCNIRIAVDRDYKPKDGERETDFFRVTVWGSTADFVSRYFSKGQMILINGRLQSRNYEDKDGNKRTAIEIVGNQVNFAASKREEGKVPSAPAEEIEEIGEEGGLPF